MKDEAFPVPQQEIINHVPSQAELIADAKVTEALAHVSLGSTVEAMPVDLLDVLPSVPRPSVADQVSRQMSIDRADRSNRANAGLPPRTFDLR